ncbi:MAG: HAD hydrolase-like protein [Mycobacteriales bacterium]
MFDLDGTLTDPYEGIANSVRYAFDKLDRPAPCAEALRGFIGPPLQDTFATLLPADEVATAVELYRVRFSESGWRENFVYDGIPEMLTETARRGHRMAVVTSKPTVFAKRILDHFELAAHFERVVGATLDGALRHKADLVQAALAIAHVTADEAVMVGDRAHDVFGAIANHARAVGVTWGYAEPGELEQAGAHAIASRPAEVTAAAGL